MLFGLLLFVVFGVWLFWCLAGLMYFILLVLAVCGLGFGFVFVVLFCFDCGLLNFGFVTFVLVWFVILWFMLLVLWLRRIFSGGVLFCDLLFFVDLFNAFVLIVFCFFNDSIFVCWFLDVCLFLLCCGLLFCLCMPQFRSVGEDCVFVDVLFLCDDLGLLIV